MQDFQKMLTTHTDTFLQWATESAKTVGSFAAEQAPLYIQEYLRWMLVQNIVLAAGYIAAICAVVYFGKKWIPKAIKFETDELGAPVFSIVFGAFPALAGCVFMAVQVFATVNLALKVYIAPRVVLVEKMAELAKQVKP